METVRRRLDDETRHAGEGGAALGSAVLPGPYQVRMSNLGFEAIYRGVHAHPSATAERSFSPANLDAWRAARLPPVSVETQRPLSQFPVLAFSVAYELELSGVFEILSLAGIGPKREVAASLIVAGGPLTFANADPLEDFVDVFVRGESEDLLPPSAACESQERGGICNWPKGDDRDGAPTGQVIL